MTTKNSGYPASGQALQRQQANSPAEAVKAHRAFFEARMPAIEKWCRQGIDPRALVRFLLHDLQTNTKLRECTRESLYLGLLACAVTGLEPGPLKGEAYLVPFAGKAVFVPGWKGLVKQVRRSRDVVGIVANVVCDGDVFEVDLGTANSIVHRPAMSGRGEVIAAYAIATLANGHREIELMDHADLKDIRRVAEQRGKSPAWQDWPEQMQRKSAIRRLCHRLPKGDDYFIALKLENAHNDDGSQADVLDVETDGEASATAGAGVRMTEEEKAAVLAHEAKEAT